MVVAVPFPGSAVPMVKNAAVESVAALKSANAGVVNGLVYTQKLVWRMVWTLGLSAHEVKEDRWSCEDELWFSILSKSPIYIIFSKIN